MIVEKIISGGQTGVDRAALDVALDLHIPCGGWCPKGRWAEDGAIPSKYPLYETPSEDRRQRTEWNVWQADATLIITRGNLTGGTAYTYKVATTIGKPIFVIDLCTKPNLAGVIDWLKTLKVKILNVAGSRESETPGIYAEASKFLRDLLSAMG